ncbi:MAG: recombinase family protein, partial [Ruminococcus sp.]|nr:recombinase family protein [Ruminococcus sp.]
GNGSPRVSQGVTLCGEWACQLTLSIAVSGSMKQNMGLQSRPLLESPLRRTETPLRAVRACGAEN